jgi:hypothetical protein
MIVLARRHSPNREGAGRTDRIGRMRYRLGSIELSREAMLAFPTDPREI